MSAHASAGQPLPASRGCPLLVVIDPVARTLDGESVRIAKDVLRARATTMKICLPESADELERILAHRGRRRPVVIGDDSTLLRTLRILYREGTLARAALSFVPVGPHSALSLARVLGVPQSAVDAARAALDGVERALDLLVDDVGGIVVGALHIPGGHPREPAQDGGGAPDPAEGDRRHWLDGARSLVRTLTAPLPGVVAHVHHAAHRLRVEADGVLLADLDRPVHEVSVRAPADGLAEVVVRHPHDHGEAPAPVRAKRVTVSGRDFRYRADQAVSGPVRHRTWTVEASAWRLTVPK